MKLELKHIAPYLPYGLKVSLEGKVKELVGLEAPYKTNNNFFIKGEVRVIGGTYKQTHSMCLTEQNCHLCKLILQPLTPIQNFVVLTTEECLFVVSGLAHNIPQWKFEILLENHFDVFGLIEQGLAIDKNTLTV